MLHRSYVTTSKKKEIHEQHRIRDTQKEIQAERLGRYQSPTTTIPVPDENPDHQRQMDKYQTQPMKCAEELEDPDQGHWKDPEESEEEVH